MRLSLSRGLTDPTRQCVTEPNAGLSPARRLRHRLLAHPTSKLPNTLRRACLTTAASHVGPGCIFSLTDASVFSLKWSGPESNGGTDRANLVQLPLCYRSFRGVGHHCPCGRRPAFSSTVHRFARLATYARFLAVPVLYPTGNSAPRPLAGHSHTFVYRRRASSGGRSRTCCFQVMSLARYRFSTPHHSPFSPAVGRAVHRHHLY